MATDVERCKTANSVCSAAAATAKTHLATLAAGDDISPEEREALISDLVVNSDFDRAILRRFVPCD